MGKFGVVSKPVEDVTVLDLKTAFPAKKDTITEATAKLINDAQNDPTFSIDGFMRTLVEYQDVMIKGNMSMRDYINAIKFCSYLEAEDFSIVDAYKRSRATDRFVLERLDAPTDSSRYKELTSAASRYHKSPLVRQILVQSDMPLYLMFQGARYKAVNTLVTEMETATYAKDRITAAKEILTHVKPPEEAKVELEIGISEESKSMQQILNDQLVQIATNQKALLEAGGDIKDVQKVSVNLIEDAEIV